MNCFLYEWQVFRGHKVITRLLLSFEYFGLTCVRDLFCFDRLFLGDVLGVVFAYEIEDGCYGEGFL